MASDLCASVCVQVGMNLCRLSLVKGPLKLCLDKTKSHPNFASTHLKFNSLLSLLGKPVFHVCLRAHSSGSIQGL